jgi:hypothetical protein
MQHAPRDTAKVRLQLQRNVVAGVGGVAALPKYRGLLDTAATIAREEGASALWKGVVPGLHRQRVYRGLSLGLYEPVCIYYYSLLLLLHIVDYLFSLSNLVEHLAAPTCRSNRCTSVRTMLGMCPSPRSLPLASPLVGSNTSATPTKCRHDPLARRNDMASHKWTPRTSIFFLSDTRRASSYPAGPTHDPLLSTSTG